MNRLSMKVFVLSMLAILVTSPSLLAQKGEVQFYGGRYWPGSSSVGEIKDGGIYGARVGFYVDPSFEIEGNFGYMNHFEVKGTDPKTRGLLFELAGTYNFSERNYPLPAGFTPNISIGAGAIRTRLDTPFNFSRTEFLRLDNGTTLNVVRPFTVDGGDTFFTVSIGAGVKSNRLWGPVGLRGDVRGRILPNYYGAMTTWLETTGGITIEW